MLETLKKYRVVFLGVLIALALFLRLYGVGKVGFSEDEVHKVEAGHSYLHGDFMANLEHPMFMKELITLSMVSFEAWNRHVGPAMQVSEEVAVRLPNIIFGALTAWVIFLFAEEMFGFTVGLLSAGLWAVGINAITINRVAKEDSLLVFFTWLAFYFYLKAKSLGASGTLRQTTYYSLGGASFGLMMASKYFPHYFGLNALYYHVLGRQEKNQPAGRRNLQLLIFFLGLSFLIFNPVIFSPGVIHYFLTYVREQTLTHHGYFMMGHLYRNDVLYAPGSTPLFYYFLFLLVKIPLPLLVSFIAGLVVIFKQKSAPGHFFLRFMFLFWIIPFSFFGGKFLRYTLSLMPTFYMISALGMVKLFDLISTRLSSWRSRQFQPALVTAFVAFFALAPLWSVWQSAPFYSLYLNPLGGGREAYFFPPDEVYDVGLRETIRQICLEAPVGADVGGESPSVFKYYFEKFGRTDLHYFNLSDPAEKDKALSSAYVVVQEGRKYFENISLINTLESHFVPIATVTVRSATAARVYKVENLAQLRKVR